MVAAGGGMILQMASSNTVVQTIVEEDKRGRVMSLFAMAFFGTVPFGSLMSGALAHRVGAQNTILVGGISCILAAGVFMRVLPELQRVVRPIYVRLGILPQVAASLEVATEPES